jgi:hypothetical protein
LSNIDYAELRYQNMSEMLNRLGLDAVTLARGRLGIDLHLAVRMCQSCDADQACKDWLVQTPGRLDKASAFCRNAELPHSHGI